MRTESSYTVRNYKISGHSAAITKCRITDARYTIADFKSGKASAIIERGISYGHTVIRFDHELAVKAVTVVECITTDRRYRGRDCQAARNSIAVVKCVVTNRFKRGGERQGFNCLALVECIVTDSYKTARQGKRFKAYTVLERIITNMSNTVSNRNRFNFLSVCIPRAFLGFIIGHSSGARDRQYTAFVQFPYNRISASTFGKDIIRYCNGSLERTAQLNRGTIYV